MTRLSLYDPGMQPTGGDYASPEAAIQALQAGRYPNYTDALISTSRPHHSCGEP